MDSLQKLQEKQSQTVFDKKVLTATSRIQAYVKHRIHIAESTGILPKNMYHSNGIIDDGILKLYEKGFDKDAETLAVKLELFKIVDLILEDVLKREAFHKNTVSTDTILKDELQLLEEDFTVDGNNDYVMLEELDDISYKQGDYEKHLFLFDDHNTKVLQELEVRTDSQIDNRKLIGKFYHWLPIRVSNVVDLYIIGKLNFEEISTIKQIEVGRIENILKEVKKQFRSHVG